jgi:uncharacterized protein (TIGR03086 family)
MTSSPMTTDRLPALAVYQRASAELDPLVRRVERQQWELPTPCEAWTVRDLVNHLVAENRWVPPLLAGLTIDEVGEQLNGDLLGDDPVRAWTAALDNARRAATADGATVRTVHLSFGDVPGEEYLRQVGADHLVHGWDLAVALGADSRLDPELVTAVDAWFADQEAGYRLAGAVGPRLELAAGADAQAKLLARFGRKGRDR